MSNILDILLNPQFKAEVFIEYLSHFRRGGLRPESKDSFTKDLLILKNKTSFSISEIDHIIKKYNIIDIKQDDLDLIMLNIQKDALKKSEKCWHPLASTSACSKDKNGHVQFIHAHTIQNNRILNLICEDSHVYGYSLNISETKPIKISRNDASTFSCFCNTHDKIFDPIENSDYKNTSEQNFLFAYRAFIASSVPKLAQYYSLDIDRQGILDTEKNKEIFNGAIINSQYDIVTTEVFELDSFYPVSACSSFDLDFDFEGNPISHSEDRMECIYVTLFPTKKKTYFLLSYLTQDFKLYSQLGSQLKKRNNLKSDISVLVLAHVENIFYQPCYYKAVIQSQETSIDKLMQQTQFDFVIHNEEDKKSKSISLTPKDYLSNKYNVGLFR
ncbi:MAG: hypothetical protein IPG01_13400 [Chitinophagaceae bacterium]|nr:hypothetical protein [Chitinophagaceae bacterium]